MSACDTCRDPGACCRSIRLWGGIRNRVRAEMPSREFVVADHEDPRRALDAATAGFGPEHQVPFLPVAKRETIEPRPLPDWDGPLIGEALSTYTWNCPRLLPNGRCGDYENRPWLCQVYEPVFDPLCVEHDPEALARREKAAEYPHDQVAA